jgi:cyclophilin family peptidyl-prolyl cis-trans isomerase
VTPPATTAAARPSPTPPACTVKQFADPAKAAVVQLANGASFTITLRPDKAPNTAKNFANIARSGCYDNLIFHRVEPNFVVQGGDPAGNGSGGGTQPAEYNDLPFVKGAVGIARGNDRALNNAYQFFVCIGECRFLDNNYTNFGNVTDGQSVADGIKIGDKMKTITIQ